MYVLTTASSTAGVLGIGQVTGNAGENNCYPCQGGALLGGVSGECGNFTLMTMAVFARTF